MKYIDLDGLSATTVRTKTYIDTKATAHETAITILTSAADATGVVINSDNNTASFVPPTGSNYLTSDASTIVAGMGQLDAAIKGIQDQLDSLIDAETQTY